MISSQNKAKKLLFLITKSNWGGAQKYVYDLATNLPQDQYTITVAFGGTGAKGADTGRLAEQLTQAGIRTIPITSFTRDIFFWHEIFGFIDTAKIIYCERPDILHLNSSKAAGIGAFFGRLFGIKKIIYTVHGWPFNEERSWWQKTLIYFFTWLTCFLAHEVIVISKENYDQAKKLPLIKNKIHLIYNGVKPIPFLSKKDAREKLATTINNASTTPISLTDDEVIIGTIAELHPNKDLKTLVAAMNEAQTSKLIIISGGEEYDRLTDQIKQNNLADRVFLTGFLAEAATYLQAFDIFVLPSKKEGHPYVVLEAGMAELPVIGSNISGINDIITDQKNGLLFPVGDSTALATAIKILIKNEEQRKVLGQALKQKVEAEYSFDQMIKQTESLYRQGKPLLQA